MHKLHTTTSTLTYSDYIIEYTASILVVSVMPPRSGVFSWPRRKSSHPLWPFVGRLHRQLGKMRTPSRRHCLWMSRKILEGSKGIDHYRSL